MYTTDTTSIKTKQLVILSMFSAIIILMAATPIGFIHLGFVKATIIHIPVTVGSIILGPKMGAMLGFVFGASSLITNTISPVISSFVFSPLIPVPGTSSGSPWALLICFIPRILVGVIPWYVYRLLNKLVKDIRLNIISLAVAAVAGSATNTLLVTHFIYFLFKKEYAIARGVAENAVYKVITSIIIGNGIPEAVVAAIVTTLVCKTLFVVLNKNQ